MKEAYYVTSFSIAVKSQSNLQEKTFNWGLAYSFKGWVHDQHGEKHGSRQADMVLRQQLRAYMLRQQPQSRGGERERERELEMPCAFENSKPTPGTHLLQGHTS